MNYKEETIELISKEISICEKNNCTHSQVEFSLDQLYMINKALEAKEPEQLRQEVERLTNSVIEMSKSIGMLKTESERFKDALKDIAYAKSKIYSIHHENYAIKIALEALAPQIEGK